jgi:hypothetical protein
MAEDDDEKLGGRFYLWLAGLVLLGGLGLLIVLLIFSRAFYAWGIFGAFIVFAAALLIFGWFYDKRATRKRWAD